MFQQTTFCSSFVFELQFASVSRSKIKSIRISAENSEPADQIATDSLRSDTQEFGNFRQIGEIILELEQAYPSNSFANINKGFSPVDGRFGPESNFTRVGTK
jgi:hypothetical protein